MEQKRTAMSNKLAHAQAVLKSGLADRASKAVDSADKKVPMSWGPMMRK